MFFTNFYYYFLIFLISPFWHRVLENALGCAIGSFAAIFVSYWIYIQSIKQNIKTSENDRIADETNQLRAFKIMIEAAIKTSDRMIASIEEFIVSLKKHPVVFPIPALTSFGNLERIINSVTVEKTGKSFLKFFPDENALKEFLSILELVDYLYAEFGGLHDLVERASTNHTERLIKVSDAFIDADKILIGNVKNMNIETPIVRKIFAIKLIFLENRRDEYDLNALNDLYFIPMKEVMLELLKIENNNEFAQKYIYELTRGIDDYKAIGVGLESFIATMIRIQNTAKENLAKLKTNSEKILRTNFK